MHAKTFFSTSGFLEFNSHLTIILFHIVYEPNPFFTLKHVVIWLCFSSIPRSYFFHYPGTKSWRMKLTVMCTHFHFFFPEEIAISDALICSIKCSLKYSLKRQKRMWKLRLSLDCRLPAFSCSTNSQERLKKGDKSKLTSSYLAAW